MWQDFKAFLIKDNVIGLAIAVIIGLTLNKLVTSVVDDIIMPLVGAMTPSGDWRALMLQVGSVQFGVGDLMGNILDFVIVAFVVFLIVKAFIKEATPAKETK